MCTMQKEAVALPDKHHTFNPGAYIKVIARSNPTPRFVNKEPNTSYDSFRSLCELFGNPFSK